MARIRAYSRNLGPSTACGATPAIVFAFLCYRVPRWRFADADDATTGSS